MSGSDARVALRLGILVHFVFALASAAAARPDAAIDSFLAWFDTHGNRSVGVASFGELGYGLVALGPIQQGDVIISAPPERVITIATVLASVRARTDLPPSAAARLEAALGHPSHQQDALALFLMRERALGGSSEWGPYLRVLPREPPGTAAWDEGELAALQDPDAAAAAARARAALAAAYARALPMLGLLMADVDLAAADAAYAGEAWGVPPHEAAARLAVAAAPPPCASIAAAPAPDTEQPPSAASLVAGCAPGAGVPGFGLSHRSLPSFAWARGMLESRAMHLRGRLLLAPLADMANYAPQPGSEARAPDNGAHFLAHHAASPGGGLAVRADRGAPPGAHLLEDYGDDANDVYVKHHGFAAPENPRDCVRVALPRLAGRAAATAAALGLRGDALNRSVCLRAPELSSPLCPADGGGGQGGGGGGAPSREDCLHAHHRWWIGLSGMPRVRLSNCATAVRLARSELAAATRAGRGSLPGLPPSVAAKCPTLASPAALDRATAALFAGALAGMPTSLQADDRVAAALADWKDARAAGGAGSGATGQPLSAAAAEAAALTPRGHTALLYRIGRKRILSALARHFALRGGSGDSGEEGEGAPGGESSSLSVGGLPHAGPAAHLAEGAAGLLAANSAIIAAVAAPPPTHEPAAPTAAVSTPAPASPPAPHNDGGQQRVPVGLALLPPRDAAAYATPASAAAAAGACDAFNAWFAAHTPSPCLVACAPVDGGMRLGVRTTADVPAEAVYLGVPLSAVMDETSARSDDLLGPVLRAVEGGGEAGVGRLGGFDALLLQLLTEAHARGSPHAADAAAAAAAATGAPGALPPLRAAAAAAAARPSRWGPYLAVLPSPAEMLQPLFWTPAEEAQLRGSPVRGDIRRYRDSVGARWAAWEGRLLPALGAAFPEVFPPAPAPAAVVTRARFEWAAAVLDSRSIWWGGARHLVPMLDLVNAGDGPVGGRVHATTLEPAGGGGGGGGAPPALVAATRADRNFSAGAQLFESYGQPSHTYLTYHGFSYAGNPHDCARVDVVVSRGAPGVAQAWGAGGHTRAAALLRRHLEELGEGPEEQDAVADDSSATAVTAAAEEGRRPLVLRACLHPSAPPFQLDGHGTLSWAGVAQWPAGNAEAARVVAAAHGVSLAGAVARLRRAAARALAAFPTSPAEDVAALARDADAQAALRVAPEGEVGGGFVALVWALREMGLRLPAGAEEWRGAAATAAPPGGVAAALLPPRVREAVRFRVVQKALLAAAVAGAGENGGSEGRTGGAAEGFGAALPGGRVAAVSA